MARKWKIIALTGSILIVVGVAIWVGIISNRVGYKRGWQDAQVAVQKYLVSHQEPVVFINPNNEAMAMVYDGGICEPYPHFVPLRHHIVYVAESWSPCSAVTIAPYIHPVQVMEAFK